MSILYDAMKKKISFGQAAAEIGDWITKLLNTNQGAQEAIAAIQSDLKQAASNAIALGDSALGPLLGDAVAVVEPALDAVLVKYAGPVAGIAVPLMNDTIDKIAQTIKSEADMWAAKAKANLSPHS